MRKISLAITACFLLCVSAAIVQEDPPLNSRVRAALDGNSANELQSQDAEGPYGRDLPLIPVF